MKNPLASKSENDYCGKTDYNPVVHSWDESKIADLYRAAGWWKEEYDESDLRHLMRGSYLFAVAVDTKTDRAVGMGRILSDGFSDGYIQDLVVLPEYRKTGIGGQIVVTLVNKCVEQGLSWIGLICRTNYRKILPALWISPYGRTYSIIIPEGFVVLTQENFKPVTLEDRAFFERHYAQYPQTHSDNTFTNMVCWNHYAHYKYAYVEKNIIIASTIDDITRFRPPIGPHDPLF